MNCQAEDVLFSLIFFDKSILKKVNCKGAVSYTHLNRSSTKSTDLEFSKTQESVQKII